MTPQQLPVFRAGTVLVRVDTYPRKDGKIVEGLTKDDFQVIEDGKPQGVDGFEFIRVEPNTPDAELRDPTSVADGERQAADPHNRVFVVYLDMFHTTVSGSYYAAQPVDQLPNAHHRADRSVRRDDAARAHQRSHVRAPDGNGRQRARKYWDWGERDRLATVPAGRHRKQTGVVRRPGLVELYREDQTATSLEQLVTRLQNLRDERKNILFMSEGWVPRRGNMPGFGGSGRPNIPAVGIGPAGQLQMGARQGDDIDRALLRHAEQRGSRRSTSIGGSRIC